VRTETRLQNNKKAVFVSLNQETRTDSKGKHYREQQANHGDNSLKSAKEHENNCFIG